MIPQAIVYYVRGRGERQPGTKVAKAAFVNVGDALIFWEALGDDRKRYLTMETVDGEPILEIAHTGFADYSGGHYSHAAALTASRPLPPRERDRKSAERVGWEFVPVVQPGHSPAED